MPASTTASLSQIVSEEIQRLLLAKQEAKAAASALNVTLDPDELKEITRAAVKRSFDE